MDTQILGVNVQSLFLPTPIRQSVCRLLLPSGLGLRPLLSAALQVLSLWGDEADGFGVLEDSFYFFAFHFGFDEYEGRNSVLVLPTLVLRTLPSRFTMSTSSPAFNRTGTGCSACCPMCTWTASQHSRGKDGKPHTRSHAPQPPPETSLRLAADQDAFSGLH